VWKLHIVKADWLSQKACSQLQCSFTPRVLLISSWIFVYFPCCFKYDYSISHSHFVHVALCQLLFFKLWMEWYLVDWVLLEQGGTWWQYGTQKWYAIRKSLGTTEFGKTGCTSGSFSSFPLFQLLVSPTSFPVNYFCSCRSYLSTTSKSRPVTSLGHQEGQRVFWEGPKFFKLCPIVSNNVQHIFPERRIFFRGAKPPATLLVTSLSKSKGYTVYQYPCNLALCALSNSYNAFSISASVTRTSSGALWK